MVARGLGILALSRLSPIDGYLELLPGMPAAGFGMGLAFVSITIAAVGEPTRTSPVWPPDW
ncbi:hypothetical protein [Nocardia sp. NPDC047654]|uniref:hypothetical protein n=1 Tax=Nocardia sp. NPDC047654 TaxID=3364314 RepID=UPI00371CF29D